MKKSLINYHNELDELLEKKLIENKEEVLNNIYRNICFYQHERLIHLIVTFFVGIAAILFLAFSLILDNIGLLILFILTFILFIPYILHYYFLENGVQELYNKFNQIEKK